MSYPVLFPECMRARPHGPGSFLYSYNAFRDPPVVLRAVRKLLNRYDSGRCPVLGARLRASAGA